MTDASTDRDPFCWISVFDEPHNFPHTRGVDTCEATLDRNYNLPRNGFVQVTDVSQGRNPACDSLGEHHVVQIKVHGGMQVVVQQAYQELELLAQFRKHIVFHV